VESKNPRKFRFFQEILKRISIISKINYADLCYGIHAKFQVSSFYPDGLNQIFQEKFKIFLRKFQIFTIMKKFLIEQPKRHLLPKFEPSRIFTKNSKMILIFLTPEFSQEISKFQNSEYEVHQSSTNDEG
jgi:hypothetical protein